MFGGCCKQDSPQKKVMLTFGARNLADRKAMLIYVLEIVFTDIRWKKYIWPLREGVSSISDTISIGKRYILRAMQSW